LGNIAAGDPNTVCIPFVGITMMVVLHVIWNKEEFEEK
jgi:hypothetical protein